MVKGEPFVKCAREGDDVVPVVKDNDAVPVVTQDEALVDPFGDRDDWAIGILSKAFLKIRHVLQKTCLGTLKPPRDEKVNNYVFIFTTPPMSWKNY
jgi:hypothetical protein